MSARFYLLTLPIRVGKTLYLREWARRARDARSHGADPWGPVGGICGPDIDGLRVWEDLATGHQHPWQRPQDAPADPDDIPIGRYRFAASGFRWALDRLHAATADPHIRTLVVDEIGPLEIQHDTGLAPTLTTWLQTMRQPEHAGRNVLLVVRPNWKEEAVLKWGLACENAEPLLLPPPPSLVGCVLAGGKSTRMGRDKAFLGQTDPNLPSPPLPAFERAARQLTRVLPAGTPVCISGPGPYPHRHTLPDHPRHAGAGPRSGLLSVADAFPQASILLLGVDYPLLHDAALHRLLQCHRLSGKSVCFASADPVHPEPLVAIYRPGDCRWLRKNDLPLNAVWRERDTVRLPHDPSLHLVSIDHHP